MKTSKNRRLYERRMHKVVCYIDDHLDEALDLETLADVAHFSAYHFHRLFAAWKGETIGDYVRRIRIEISAIRLSTQPTLTITQVALDVGFGSAEAFTRAFKKRFACTPTVWRQKHSKFNQLEGKINQAETEGWAEDDSSDKKYLEMCMHVTLMDRKEANVVYLRNLGPYGPELAEFWDNTVAPWIKMNNFGANARYGISHDDPSITEPKHCRYDACVEVEKDYVVTGKAFKTTIPAGRYAMLDFNGSADEIGDVWTSLLKDWLPSSGLHLDARPCFEYYPVGADDDSDSGKFACQICIPVSQGVA